jgi:thymidylate kinase
MERLRGSAELGAIVDAAVRRPVLVVGTPPPHGRDLDVLARPREHAAVVEVLRSEGLQRWRHVWTRPEVDRWSAVDLATTQKWRSRSYDPDRLFREAEPVPGYRHLVTPSPATVLLLAARGTVTRRGQVTDKTRRRVTAALERDPDAWVRAEREARDLGLVRAVRMLRRACDDPAPLAASDRVVGVLGVALTGGLRRSALRAVADARPRGRRPVVVSFSGLDGSGKSTQAAKLCASLAELGVPAQMQWAGFRTAGKVKRAIPLLDRQDLARVQEPTRERDPLVPWLLRDRPLALQAWMGVVVGVNAIALWRYVLKRRGGARVLVFDRFTPDSAVKLDMHYQDRRGMDIGWQRALFRTIGPKPDVGFYVAVSSEEAYRRRQEQTPEELEHMARLYEVHHTRFGLIKLDGTAAMEDLARAVRVATWDGLP